MSAEELAEFVLKRQLLVVFLLPGGVCLHGRDIRLADRERALSGLPREFGLFRKCLVHPARRVGLDQVDNLGDRMHAAERHEQMNVVRHPAGREQFHLLVVEDAADVRIQARRDVIVDERYPILGAENDVAR